MLKSIKNRFPIKLLLFFIVFILVTGCHQDNSPAPLEFTAYDHNPILSPGEPGSWDELFLWSPQIIYHEGVYNLFYLGGNVNGRMAIGIATSPDGYNFTKFQGNPVLSPDNEGFDAVTVGPGIVLRGDSAWLMYYNAQDLVTFAPGQNAGVATAESLTGPWIKNETPVISSGNTGEWDAGFIIPSTVLISENGNYVMFYSGGEDIASFKDFYVGMATSGDGINWKKYNNLETTDHPFANSDPVLITGKTGDWDGAFVWMANVTKSVEGFRMYYSAARSNMRNELKAIGYATSNDGIHWEKYPGNPVYESKQDPFALSSGKTGFLENPSILDLDTICLMYYECGPYNMESCYISMATAPAK